MSWKIVITALGLVAFAVLPVEAHDRQGHSEEGSGPEITDIATPKVDPARAAKARKYFTDLPVVTQDNETLRFYSDVLENQVVLVSLFYTNCTGMCPLTNAKLADVQRILGDQLGKGVRFVSITLDPETDTPEVLKDYAAKFEAREGWLFLTGETQNIKTITFRLGQTDPNIAAHNPFFMLGNVNRAHWTKLPPNMPASSIATRLQLLTQFSAE